MINSTPYVENLGKFLVDMQQVLALKPQALSSILGTWATAPHVPAVYIISTPHDDEIVYVGKTRKDSVANRFDDHCKLTGGSDLRGMLRIFMTYHQNAMDYNVRWLHIPTPRLRTQFECFLIGVLQPPFNK